MHRISIMSKPGCHLCEAALLAVQKVVGTHVDALIEEIDITQEQDLLEKYRNDIPVILVDGIERFRAPIDPDKLAAFFYTDLSQKLLGF